MTAHKDTSLETIMTHDNRDLSQWSVVWSTSQIPDMDTATGGGPRRRIAGRRKLTFGSLAMGTLLAMHCRVAAAALTGGIFLFMMFFILAVTSLGNPLRHFEVYLGQWSISGPGRAFHIIPMLDGIGIAICINALIRAIFCCSMASISAIYLSHAVSDAKLPFTYCRDFDLNSYEPILKEVRTVRIHKFKYPIKNEDDEDYFDENRTQTERFPELMRNVSIRRYLLPRTSHKVNVCNEIYNKDYPQLFKTPAYNFFYVEVVRLRQDYSLGEINLPLMIANVIVWCVIWVMMISERIRHGKLIWNNMYMWIVIVPWVWTIFLSLAAISSLISIDKTLEKVLRVGSKEFLSVIGDAFEVSLYIHSVSVGTELVHGKGLNHYASGHIDPSLHGEMVWHSTLVWIVSTLHLVGTALCALVDYAQPGGKYHMRESTLWIMPMYSRCASLGNYSHFMTTIIFGGLMFSYMTVAFVLVKTALHTIFEYRVRLVFKEQFVVGALIMTCMGLSLVVATNGGIALLESVDAVMTGITIPLICLLETMAMFYVYRGSDFMSDMNLATEDNACSSRVGIQWQMIPFITIVIIIIKVITLVEAELPLAYKCAALAPLAGVVLAVPLRACVNAYFFLQPKPRV